MLSVSTHLKHNPTRIISRFSRLFYSTTASPISPMLDTSPPIHRINEGTTSLNRDLFQKSIPILAARMHPAKIGTFINNPFFRRVILDLPRTRSVISDKDSESKLLLFRIQGKDELPQEMLEFMEKKGVTLVDHTVKLSYDFWNTDDILYAILPEELVEGAPSGFAAMGHLAHLNLREEYLPYKYIIGQVILDKNPRIRTVVNKLDTIHSQFRFFDMELIAGEPDFVVQHRESNCQFTFDFREVYWNSRLHTEHERLINLFNPEEGIVADVMAGVGPFAVPSAKKGCAVLANDLNPACSKWHRKNVADNNVAENLRVYCEDGRDFIRSSFRRAFDEPFAPYTERVSLRKKQRNERKNRQEQAQTTEGEVAPKIVAAERPKRNRIDHFVMNLPDSAISFLDAFRGVLSTSDRALCGIYESLPLIHCHCFTRFVGDEAEADIRERVETVLGGKLEGDEKIHLVRSVAPGKDMYCISFRLPHKVAYAS
ncbi:tRNA (guanine-N(1)-)-methyltransferase [Pyrrhoderma noxium]|uniref:tRNA (guanine(37)-N1)-methyltransferase n=1 Tax=Pyrrhoderma noxium TaxID=2282107 RepID=A0A286URH4_9AGAM|nr:tRNA (guanine-N(1)-)-methyltransferase [Pyrrhoderma noxium]